MQMKIYERQLEQVRPEFESLEVRTGAIFVNYRIKIIDQTPGFLSRNPGVRNT
jgi:hypothetical protein